MKLFIAFVATLDTVFDTALHCDPNAPLFSFSMSEVEDQVAQVTFTRIQSGWSFIAPSQPKNFLVSWSPTKRPEDAVLLCRGRVTEMPGDLLGNKQVIVGKCAPKDIDHRILAYAKANLDTAPYTDFLFSDADPEDSASYLLARSFVYHVDPRNHLISLVREATGPEDDGSVFFWDMSEAAYFPGGRPSDGPGEHGKLVRTVRAQLTVDFTQEASGVTNVGSTVSLSTLDPDFCNDLASRIIIPEAEGWSQADTGTQTVRVKTTAAPVTNAALYESTTRVELFPGNFIEQKTEHSLSASLVVHSISGCHLPMRYEYSQERREIVYAALDLPVQDTGIEDDEEELVEFSLKDLFVDPRVTDYVQNFYYYQGQLVRYNGETWRCLASHYSQEFRQLQDQSAPDLPITAGAAYALLYYKRYSKATFWEKVTDEWTIRPSMYSFADTQRGRQVIQHLMLRLRKEGVRRMRARRVTMSFRWEDAAHLTRADTISFIVPDPQGDNGYRSILGKITALTWTWPENGPPTIQVEVGVSFGVASGGTPSGGYVTSGYMTYGYTENDSTIDDVVFETQADPIYKPVDVASLAVGFGVLGVRKGGLASEQLAMAQLLARKGADIRQAPSARPTWVEIRLRPLPTYEPIIREIDVVGTLTRGSQDVYL